MSLANLGSHWWVILIIVVLLFGAPKLPALAKSMGQSMRIFKNEIKTGKDEDAAKTPAQSAPASPASTGTVPPAAVSTDNGVPGDNSAKS
jgi:sec-independent protein translocase protein TatA